MLAVQEYGGHKSIHDDSMAQGLGFKGAPIEGPTHFSQFVPLLHQLWGRDWEEHGCLSAHYNSRRSTYAPGLPIRSVVSSMLRHYDWTAFARGASYRTAALKGR